MSTDLENDLPDKPSELLQLALIDLRACEQDPDYVVDMGVWHTTNADRTRCRVCLAGAVLAKTLDCPKSRHQTPAIYEDAGYDDLARKLWALDALRQGEIHVALVDLGIDPAEYGGVAEWFGGDPDAVSRYEDDREQWYEDMEMTINHLKEHGL